ncbi:PKHD1L1 [Bugula neritina]|uniref:PKHD1L1 n=1 Tax=Bugula neritina TaxID=10212 RepID=A0A7J7KFB1_BUGNE|nr:PKHD1L1 [Bugula neritina]
MKFATCIWLLRYAVKTNSYELVILDVPNGLSSTVCDVVVTLSTENVTLSAAYTYDSSLGGSIASVSPSRGGTAGGTTLTITGTNLDNPAGVNVTIDGVACVISSNDGSTIECRTDAHQGSIEADVKVKLGSDGFAVVPENVEATFFYVDVWSSVYTWGGGPLPEEGDLVEIPQGQTLLLDMDTPVLKVLLIRGKLVFDEKDVELQAENILIVDGGTLQVGTEDEPFQHKGIITMHGHLRSLEMPIYGAKTLGVRNGTLDLHGKPKEPWTVLAQTANAGATEIVLERPVHWEVGDRIAIASTGHRHSQIENEEREIAAISADGFTLTLTEALDYKHLGVTADLGGGHTLEMRAEVGLLTHNVVFRGSDHHQWKDVIEACPAGFDTGYCFLLFRYFTE